MSDPVTDPMGASTLRIALPLTADVASGRWFLSLPRRESVVELTDSALLEWARNCVDPDELHSARFRRPLAKDWLTAEQASALVRQERGEIVGARTGAAFAALTGLPVAVLTQGGGPREALLLALVLAASGAPALIRRGADVLPRVLIVQALAALGVGVATYGLGGLVAALYLPVAFMALFSAVGSRAGGAVGRVIHARDRARLVTSEGVPAAGRTEDAVAA